MIKYENQCVGCPPERGCMGESCRNRNVPVMICDDCGDEVQDLWYGNDGNQYCKYCITGYIEKVVIE